MSDPLHAPVAVVTGAGVGIGLEIARRLALGGGAVVLNDVDADRVETAVAGIRDQGGRCTGVAGDAGDVEFLRSLVGHAVAEHGRIDVVVANAGLTLWCDFFECGPEEFERVVGLNLRGSFFLAQAGARVMRRQGGGGRILLMSSVLGERGVPSASLYAMTKAGLRMLARSLAVELGQFGITVNALAPGAILTERTLAEEPDYEQIWSARNPVGRAGSPADVAETALFLLSPEASYISGQTITVDGGWTAGAGEQ